MCCSFPPHFFNEIGKNDKLLSGWEIVHILNDVVLHLFCRGYIGKRNLKGTDPSYMDWKKKKRKTAKRCVLHAKMFLKLAEHLHFWLDRNYACSICIFTTTLWLSLKHAVWRVLLRVKATPWLCTCAHQTALLVGKFWNEPNPLRFFNHKLGAQRDIFSPLGHWKPPL